MIFLCTFGNVWEGCILRYTNTMPINPILNSYEVCTYYRAILPPCVITLVINDT